MLISGAFLESRLDHTPSSHIPAILSALERASALCGPASSTRTLLQAGALPLIAALGFGEATDVRHSPGGLVATISTAEGVVALLVAPFGARLDPLWRQSVGVARERGADWVLVYNGTRLRLVDSQRLHARRHLEFDLDLAANASGARAMSLTLAAAALCAGGDSSTRALITASDAHASVVCRSLRDGVLDASTNVLDALARCCGRRHLPNVHDSFEQALTIVYRLLFLLFAEARALVPLWHPIYRDGYSVDALRAAAERPGGASGMWEAVRA
ncbi:MAG TPA: hypothetical protein VFF43_05085, partial [Caldimonas sp.]|nr:hypothetical protein [Caldimonas sp.]